VAKADHLVGLLVASGQSARTTPGPPSLPLRGRNEILTSVGSHMDRLLSGSGTVLVIEGRAGMGKSRLLDEIAAIGGRGCHANHL
jgi:hypothetical protein